ncbi:restriction endonuclease subunit S [Streptomyces mexicanus]|uniref:Restriction endonuclease subunit S n=1 Tax=Streptomyces mexicanus TaxID=178566 RepID=A0A7X1HW41_9ACTN|nr:restriction endonuclease subunit S [Streptomyces mexicanus]MBC2864240.1 restriction endonuclease subunit S [Streptomyces mexicanus]
MREGWRRVSLGEILRLRSERTHSVDTLLSVTADRGVIRQSESGRRDSSSADKSLYWDVRPGDVVYNTMRMWQGVSGVASEAGIVSPAYTVCEPVGAVSSEFLRWFLKDPKLVGKFFNRSQGLVSDTWNLKYSEFKKIEVDLPPLSEQLRIAEVLDEVDAQIQAVGAMEKKDAVSLSAVISSRLSDQEHPRRKVKELLKGRPRNGFSPTEVDGWTGFLVLGLGCLTPTGFVPRQLKPVSPDVASGNSATLSDGDLLVSRANTRELVGLAGIYRNVGAPCLYPDLMMRLTPKPGVPVEFLESVFALPEVRRRIQALSQGTSDSMVKITGDVIWNLEVPVPESGKISELLLVKEDMRRRLKIHASAKVKLLRKKEALMGDLLSGKVPITF